MHNVFLEEFLKISDIKTIIFLIIFALLCYGLVILGKKKISFSSRVLFATFLGLTLGVIIQIVAGFPNDPSTIKFVNETTSWYGLIGNGFIDLIRMLVIPLVMVSIIHVIINLAEQANLGKLVKRSFITTMVMVTIASAIGLSFAMLFNLGVGNSIIIESEATIKEVVPVVTTLRGLIPANPVDAMVKSNIIGLVIFSAFVGMGARRMAKKQADVIKPFYDLVNAAHKILISMAMTIIKWMPYAVLALLANTIAQRGIASLFEVGKFILVLYLACFVMLLIQCVALLLFQINPWIYLKKSMSLLILAFTSRSSVGVLPMTIDTLTNKLGVSQATASFVSSFGTTAGMQGCAGVFPAMLIIYVANLTGISIDVSLIIMILIVVPIGSLGIAGIPGTSTMAASVGLSGVGLGSSFALITPILAIDPVVDMMRTMLNVSGSLTNAMMVDRQLGMMKMDEFMNLEIDEQNQV